MPRYSEIPIAPSFRDHTSVQRSPSVTSATGMVLARASSAARSIGLAAQSSPGSGRSSAAPAGATCYQQDRRRADVAGVVAHDEVGAQRGPVLGHAPACLPEARGMPLAAVRTLGAVDDSEYDLA
jgi:hypothetical protein